MNAIKEKFFYVLAVGVSIFFLFFIITCSWIGYEVKNQCREATGQYGGRCLESLISLLNDDHQSFRARNRAIWALGQLGDPQALPVLNQYYTGVIPAREPLNQMISQYELKKAVNLASGGFNLGAIVWRFGLK